MRTSAVGGGRGCVGGSATESSGGPATDSSSGALSDGAILVVFCPDGGGGDGSGLVLTAGLTVAIAEAAWPLTTAMETRCETQRTSLSPVRAVSRRPFVRPAAAESRTPGVSTAKRAEMYHSRRAAYRTRLRSSAQRAALPGSRTELTMAVDE